MKSENCWCTDSKSNHGNPLRTLRLAFRFDRKRVKDKPQRQARFLDELSDHEALGVIDPIDDMSTSLEGRGTRVTFKDPNEAVLAKESVDCLIAAGD